MSNHLKLSSYLRFSLAGIIIVLLFNSCRHTSDEHGIPYLIQNRYWNYYLRGVAYSLIGEWMKAAKDFEVALGREKGALYGEYHEKRRAKMYGLRFLDNYFPHRELGICNYFMNRLDAAESELTLSLEMLPSSRARFYLNKVRRSRFLMIPDRQVDPIRFDMDFADDLEYVNIADVDVGGKIFSPYLISRIKINGRQTFIELAEETYSLRERISLDYGLQRIRVEAMDLVHNRAVWEREIVIDTVGPSISVSPSPADPDGELIFTISDDYGLSSLEMEGRKVELKSETKSRIQRLPVTPFRKLEIKAKDKAGNETNLESNTGDLVKASREAINYHPDTRLADVRTGVNSGTVAGRQSPAVRLSDDGESPVVAPVISDMELAVNWPLSTSMPDTMPPRLWLMPEIEQFLAVTSKSYAFDITVEDSGYIDSVTYGINRQAETKSLRQDRCTRHQFSLRLPLQAGANNLLLLARDWSENVVNRRFTIKRRDPFDLRQDLRMSLAIYVKQPARENLVRPFVKEFEEHTEAKLGSGYIRKLSTMVDKKMSSLPVLNLEPLLEAMVWRSGHFNLLERDPETMAKLLVEEEIRNSGLADIRSDIRTGKLKAAEWILQVYLSPVAPGQDYWFLIGKLIDVYSGTIILTTVSDFSGFSEDDLGFQLQGLIDKLVQDLPILATPITRTSRHSVSIAAGEMDGVVVGRRCVFIRADASSQRYAEPMMWHGKWIQGIVNEVTDDDSVVGVYPEDAAHMINPGDHVILR